MPTMQVAAMGRLDAMLGHSLLDAPDQGPEGGAGGASVEAPTRAIEDP